jgi:hypothetical protein
MRLDNSSGVPGQRREYQRRRAVMEETSFRFSFRRRITRELTAILCVLLLRPAEVRLLAQSEAAKTPDQSAQQKAPPIPPDQLDSLVAPIALYPDPLLAQTLAASTYPLEIIQLHQWLAKHPQLKEKELAAAVAKEPWDPSVQAMAGLPDLVKRLADDIQWTTDLGNAFLAQQSDVMDAVQRMRKKAKDKGTLKSTEQQKVETKVVESKTVVVVEQANPEVVYVPSYNPVVVYGAPVYAYPPIYYPPAGYYAAGMAISFGVGVAMGAMWGGGWGWGAGWGGNNVQINNFNNFNRNVNANRNVNRSARTGGNTNWSHNPQHRGGAPYRDRATASQYSGTARGDSAANRQASARQQVNRAAGSTSSPRANAATSTGTRPSGERANSTGTRSRGSGGTPSAFGGGGGYSGSSARSAGSRGSASMGGRSMGGGRGGGGRGRR